MPVVGILPGPDDDITPHFTIVYVPPDRAAKYRDSNLHWINECVAVGDRILKLFEANTDEVFTVDWVPRAQQPFLQNHPHFVNVSTAADAADASLCVAPASDLDRPSLT